MVNINLQKEPHENCPSFEKCNTNKCPLHKNFLKLEDTSEDKQVSGWKKCRASKIVRMKIAMAFKLKSQGLTMKELGRMRKSMQMKKEVLLQRKRDAKTTKNTISQPNCELKTDRTIQTTIQTKDISSQGVKNISSNSLHTKTTPKNTPEQSCGIKIKKEPCISCLHGLDTEYYAKFAKHGGDRKSESFQEGTSSNLIARDKAGEVTGVLDTENKSESDDNERIL